MTTPPGSREVALRVADIRYAYGKTVAVDRGLGAPIGGVAESLSASSRDSWPSENVRLLTRGLQVRVPPGEPELI